MTSSTFNKMIDVINFLKEQIKCSPSEVICCFDIDQTICTIEHPAVYVQNYTKYQTELDEVLLGYKNSSFAHLPIQLDYASKIFDDTFYEAFDKIPYHKIALTAAMTGPFESINRWEIFRYEVLKQLDIVFDDPLFHDSDFILDDLPMYMGYRPVFYKGVLCSNGEYTTTNKGTALCSFLKKNDLRPKYIVQVDDKQFNLNFISDELSKQYPDTHFIGILYKGADNYCPQTISKEDFIKFWTDNCERVKNFRSEYTNNQSPRQ